MTTLQTQTVSGLELWQWRHQARQTAIAADVSVTELDWLLQQMIGLDDITLKLESFKDRGEISLPLPLANLSELWQRRLNDRVPVQYLAGVAQWRNFSLQVSPDVLIPRLETEGLIDMAIAAVAQSSLPLDQGHWADLGTGSGAIAIALADAFPNISIHAVDYDAAALAVAQVNAERYGMSDRIHFYLGSWFEPLAHLKGQFSGMIANPPYVPSTRLTEMDPEVAHEPQHAVYGNGQDGLDHVRHLIKLAPDYLMPGGTWLMEMMVGQSEAVNHLFQTQGQYRDIQIHPDYADRNRLALTYRA
ncbi:peptide chain release factor N(5)-glutamine methyltransferase [Trichocoleus sp. FACHB-262]|uniref:peptide chain release factor N(5)-glutamine methyltransferase n=1 Tax=Trichocoleus sp. FACHB-262 TaxID=2692869 RepID=UPI001686A275|nr:peptide chain release factor N(5)-glutamine methyltransferase [Trichocoleus sp. FACHB-262]MBD2120401.1 peptide chain release factor N(5)-glutamine methyltransferase [Trichocoleus sp. FACHB-262]